jgi:hypothetical protein
METFYSRRLRDWSVINVCYHETIVVNVALVSFLFGKNSFKGRNMDRLLKPKRSAGLLTGMDLIHLNHSKLLSPQKGEAMYRTLPYIRNDVSHFQNAELPFMT